MTPLGEHGLVGRYLRSIGIRPSDVSFKVNLIVMDMQEYDVILGMDGVMQHSVIIDCAKKRVWILGF